jgi:hypothetical protein
MLESWHPAEPDAAGDALVVDTTITVHVIQLRPTNLAEVLDETGGDELFLNGGPVVLLPGNRRSAERLVGLGDYAVKAGESWHAEPADGFNNRFQRA